jgi:hypothetical protein
MTKKLKNVKSYYRGGVIFENECNCGKYKPISTSGIINNSCRNCGGKPKQTLYS